ncbi:hypothetical protein [Caldalkalibacillus mannanilyticus]|nr:hypothetical protein [Caldalkalibacillus mannanilyticus]
MVKDTQDASHTYQYLLSELNRIQTIAGTLSVIENQHFKELTNIAMIN